MTKTRLTVYFAGAILLAGCAERTSSVAFRSPTVVEAACGECKFGMPGDDCNLAIRVKGRGYFVEGVDPASLGDVHAADGICEVIRKARLTGHFKGNRFVATRFEMLPEHSP